jgi:3-deoxy-D-manno-octulosonic-acid transferase
MRLFGWLLNLVYLGLLGAAAPWLMWRAGVQGRYRRGWREKLWGALPLRTDDSRPLLWFHAVSVGEVLSLRPLMARLAEQRPDVQVLLSTSTDAGYDVARQHFPHCRVTWCPLDFSWAVRRALRRVRPDLLALVELELWPNLMTEAAAAGVPVVLVNGRLSERSHRSYQRIRPLVRSLLSRCSLIAVQSHEYRRRFLSLGAEPQRVIVTGSLKFDGVEMDRRNPRTSALRRTLGLPSSAPVLVAGSTQAPEEAAALEAWLAARRTHPDLRLILVPRHPRRFEEVAALVRSRGLSLRRRSQLAAEEEGGRDPWAACRSESSETVLLVDTVGELAAVWGLADIAYVGGSLTPGRGGQNMLEPAAYGAAVLFGPHTENFRDIVAALLAEDAAVVVRSAQELTTRLRELLDTPNEARRRGERARAVVRQCQGGAERTFTLLLNQLPGGAEPSCLSRAA